MGFAPMAVCWGNAEGFWRAQRLVRGLTWRSRRELPKCPQRGNLLTQSLDLKFFAPQHHSQISIVRRTRLRCGRFRLLTSKRSQELQTKAKPSPVADDGRYASSTGHQKLQVHQVAWFERHARVKGHAALAHFDPPSLNCQFGVAAARKHANR